MGYVGSNARLRRVLAKMRRGEPFNVGVVGGSGEYYCVYYLRAVLISVSKGFGIRHADAPYAPANMHMIIFNWLNERFGGKVKPVFKESGKPTGANALMNGAQGGVGSDYFSMCFGEHMSDDLDLVLIELGELQYSWEWRD